MKTGVLAVSAAFLAGSVLLIAAAPASAQHAGSGRKAEWFAKPLGPIGLDGQPPTPLCRSSLGEARHIHCLHNIVWHGGKRYFIDDLRDPNAKPVD